MNNHNQKKWLLVSDVDDTLLGNDNALTRLVNELEMVSGRITIAYNSSRPCASQRKSIMEHADLPKPDYLIGALGTEIQQTSSNKTFTKYTSQLTKDWQRDQIVALMSDLGLEPHDDQYQTPFKASYHVLGRSQYQLALDQLRSAGLKARTIFSGNENLDIIPEGADKGKAVEFLRQMLGFDANRVIVAGDSVNDLDMFLYEFNGIVVANADAQLISLSDPHIYHAHNNHADGVLEGLWHWGAIPIRN